MHIAGYKDIGSNANRTPRNSYGGREQVLQEKAKATGGQLIGEAKEGMARIEEKGREVVSEGKEMLEKAEKKIRK